MASENEESFWDFLSSASSKRWQVCVDIKTGGGCCTGSKSPIDLELDGYELYVCSCTASSQHQSNAATPQSYDLSSLKFYHLSRKEKIVMSNLQEKATAECVLVGEGRADLAGIGVS